MAKRSRPGKEISLLVHEESAERWDQKRSQLDGPASMLTRPGRHRDRDPMRPELFLGFDQQRKRVVQRDGALAESGSFQVGSVHAKEPYGNLRSPAAQVAHGRGASVGRDTEDHRNLPIAF